MALALDEPRETDHSFDINGYTFIVDKEFMEAARPIKIDASPMGFHVTSALELGPPGCGSCGSGSDSCG